MVHRFMVISPGKEHSKYLNYLLKIVSASLPNKKGFPNLKEIMTIYSCAFSGSFIVLALFRCIIQSELTFVLGVRKGSSFILLHVDIQLS